MSNLQEQTVKVSSIEGENGVITTTYSSISNALYDLADQRSKTAKVILPNGTTVQLSALSKPGIGSYQSSFEVTAKGGDPQVVRGTSGAADLANKLDVLALSPKEKAKLMKLSESELIERAREHLPLREEKVNVSGYVTKGGKHVGPYSQIRDLINKLKAGQTLQLPDGITVKKNFPDKADKAGVYEVKGGKFQGERRPLEGGITARVPDAAAKFAVERSAANRHPKALGGEKHADANEFLPGRKRGGGFESKERSPDVERRAGELAPPGTPWGAMHSSEKEKYRRQAEREIGGSERQLSSDEAVAAKVNGIKAGEQKTLPAGTKVVHADNGNWIVNGNNVGPNKGQAATVAAAAERTKMKRAGRKSSDRPKSGDYGSMSDDELRSIVNQPETSGGSSPEQRKAAVKELNRRKPQRFNEGAEASNAQRRAEHDAKVARRDAITAEREKLGNTERRIQAMKTGERHDMGRGVLITKTTGGYKVTGRKDTKEHYSGGAAAKDAHQRYDAAGSAKPKPGTSTIVSSTSRPTPRAPQTRNSGRKGAPGTSVDDPSDTAAASARRKRTGGGALGWNANDPPEKQARDMTAGTNHTSPEEWKAEYERLTKENRSLKVDALRAAWAHAKKTGNEGMAERIMRTIQQAEGRSSKSSRLVKDKAQESAAPGGLFARH